MRMKDAMAAVLGVALAVAGPVSTHADAAGNSSALYHSRSDHSGGHPLPIVVDTGVASNTSRVEQPVRAHLSRDVRIDDQIVLPAGSELYGNVTAVRRPGKVKGRSYIAVRFNTLVPRGSNERYSIDTGRISRTGRATKKKDALEDRRSGCRRRGHRRAHGRQEGRFDWRRRRRRSRHGSCALHAWRGSRDRQRRPVYAAPGRTGQTRGVRK